MANNTYFLGKESDNTTARLDSYYVVPATANAAINVPAAAVTNGYQSVTIVNLTDQLYRCTITAALLAGSRAFIIPPNGASATFTTDGLNYISQITLVAVQHTYASGTVNDVSTLGLTTGSNVRGYLIVTFSEDK